MFQLEVKLMSPIWNDDNYDVITIEFYGEFTCLTYLFKKSNR